MSVDGSGNIILWNRAAEAIFGYSAAEAVGRTLTSLIPERFRSAHGAAFDHAVKDGSAGAPGHVMEVMALGKDGAEFPVELSVASWETGEGRCFTGVLRDISERRHAEEQASMRDAAIETSVNAIAFADPRGTLTYVNAAAMTLWGYDDPGQMLGRPITSFWEAEDSKRKITKAMLRAGNWVGELQARRDDGTLVDVQVHGSMVTDDSGAPLQLMASCVDLTDRKRAEAAHERLAHDLGKRVKELNCLYGISNLVEMQGVSLVEVLRGAANLIPPSWQYPEITCARVIHGGEEFASMDFEQTEWKQSAEIVVRGDRAGVVEVYYSEQRPESDEGPFAMEERSLINAIADELGRVVETKQAEAELEEHRDHLERLVVQRTSEFERTNTRLQNEITERRQAEVLLRGVAERISTLTGDAFLKSAVQWISEALEMKYAFIGWASDGAAGTVKTIAACMDGEPIDDFEYDLVGTPCRDVLMQNSTDVCCYVDGVQASFPDDHLLVEMGANSYAGVPLMDPAGKAHGLIVALGTEPIKNRETIQSMFRILSARVSGELGRMEAEDALREREALLNEAQRIAHVGSWEWNIVTNEIAWSSEVWRMFGLLPSASEMTYDRFMASVHRDDRDVVQEGVEDAVKGVRPYYLDHRIVLPDGRERIVHEQAEVLCDESGRPTRMTGTVQDITERTRADERLRLLSRAIEQAGEIVVISGADGAIRYVNPAFEEATGYSSSEAIGQNPRILNAGVHDASFFKNMWETVAAGGAWSGQITNRRKDGTLLHEYATISPVRDAIDNSLSYVKVSRDNTEQQGLEEQLRRSQKMEAVGRLAGGIAHDFKNLLTIIAGYTELLQIEMATDDSRLRHTSHIARAVDKASDMVKRLLAFSRKAVISPRVASLNAIVRDARPFATQIIGERVRLVTDLAEGLWHVEADPARIEEIILNLASNGSDAMPTGGTLTFTTSNVAPQDDPTPFAADDAADRYVCLSVTDTGRGMDEDTQAQLFEPFFTTKGNQGTGMGLATCYGIVKQHNGSIFCKSSRGRGTTFSVYLPAVDAPLSVRPEPVPVDLPKGRGTVLVVDDEAEILEVLGRLLEHRGHTVLTANSGSEALERAKGYEGDIQLLLTDVIMPGMDGRELAEALAEVRPGIRVLYMSGYPDKVVAKYGVLDSDIDLIEKPFRLSDLLRRIARALGRDHL